MRRDSLKYDQGDAIFTPVIDPNLRRRRAVEQPEKVLLWACLEQAFNDARGRVVGNCLTPDTRRAAIAWAWDWFAGRRAAVLPFDVVCAHLGIEPEWVWRKLREPGCARAPRRRYSAGPGTMEVRGPVTLEARPRRRKRRRVVA